MPHKLPNLESRISLRLRRSRLSGCVRFPTRTAASHYSYSFSFRAARGYQTPHDLAARQPVAMRHPSPTPALMVLPAHPMPGDNDLRFAALASGPPHVAHGGAGFTDAMIHMIVVCTVIRLFPRSRRKRTTASGKSGNVGARPGHVGACRRDAKPHTVICRASG